MEKNWIVLHLSARKKQLKFYECQRNDHLRQSRGMQALCLKWEASDLIVQRSGFNPRKSFVFEKFVSINLINRESFEWGQ